MQRQHTEANKDSCTCPICLSIMIEPVTMPCKHSLCMPCFKQTVEKANLCCPICRLRIAVWARKASKSKSLIDEKKWKMIKESFPAQVQTRLEGQDAKEDEDTDFDFEMQLRKLKEVSKPGEIRQEYEAALQKLQRQREEEAKREEEVSAALIRALQEEDEKELKDLEQHRLEMEMAGRLAAEELYQAEKLERVKRGTPASPSEGRHPKADKKKKQPRSASHTGLTLNTFFDSVQRNSHSVPPSSKLLETNFKPDSPEPYQSLSPQPSRSTSDHARIGTGRNVTVKDSDGGDQATSKTNVTAVCSTERISQFQPIVSCQQTPPKRLPNGSVVVTPLVITTPCNLKDKFSACTALSDQKIGAAPSSTFSKQALDSFESAVPEKKTGYNLPHCTVSLKSDLRQGFVSTSSVSTSVHKNKHTVADNERTQDQIGEAAEAPDEYISLDHEPIIALDPKFDEENSNGTSHSSGFFRGKDHTLLQPSSDQSSKILDQSSDEDCTLEAFKLRVRNTGNEVNTLKQIPALQSHISSMSRPRKKAGKPKEVHKNLSIKQWCLPGKEAAKSSENWSEQSKSTASSQYAKDTKLKSKKELNGRKQQKNLNKSDDPHSTTTVLNHKKNVANSSVDVPGEESRCLKRMLSTEAEDDSRDCKKTRLQEGLDPPEHGARDRMMSQEEADHLLALELQGMYSKLDSQNIKVDRFKGSEGEYTLRRTRRN